MARPKRPKLDFDTEALTRNLEQSSKGRGVQALFPEQSPPLTDEKPVERMEPAETEKSRTQTPKRARVHVPTHALRDASVGTCTDARMRTHMTKELRKAAVLRKRLSSFAFRFRPEELDRLEQAVDTVNEAAERRISKNDVVRLGLNWLLRDYEENKGRSMLVRVLRRT